MKPSDKKFPHRIWLDIFVLVAFLSVFWGIRTWRQKQFDGYGLLGTYYESTNFIGNIFRSKVETSIDFSKKKDPHFDRNPFSVQWTGTIVIPRTGQYIFATESDDGSWLEIDGQTVIDNGGQHGIKRKTKQLLLTQGPHSIKIKYFDAGAGGSIRVFWNPPGRGGILEYIPPTLLFPVLPKEIDIKKAHAIPPRDFPAAAIIFLALFVSCTIWWRKGLVLWLQKIKTQPSTRLDLAVFCTLFFLALSIRFWDISAAGQTWDEDVYWSTSRNYMQNMLDGDLRSQSWAWNREHPSVTKWIYGLATLATEDFTAARKISAGISALTCAFLFIIGRDFFCRRIGIVAALFCALMPHVLAHGKIIGLETPSGLFFALAIWTFFKALHNSENSKWFLLAGLFAGLTLSTRISNLPLLGAFAVLYLYHYWETVRKKESFPMPFHLGLMPLVMIGIFVFIWPYLWKNPIQHFGEMLSKRGDDTYTELFLGKDGKPPLYYFPLYFAVTMPTATLLTFFASFARLFHFRKDRAHLFLLVWFFMPLVMIFSPVVQDGIRYIFPALIPACLLAALGLDWIVDIVGRFLLRLQSPTTLQWIFGVAMTIYIGLCSWSVHPYYLDYYNELTGGPGAVEKRGWFEIAWWGEGLKEAADYVGKVAPKGATVRIKATPSHGILLRSDLKTLNNDNADFIIYNKLNTRSFIPPRHNVIHTVYAKDAPLCWVYARTPAPQK